MARNKYDVDEVMEDKFDLNQLKRLMHYVKPYAGQLAFALFLMLSSSALTMLFPTFIMKIMDEYIPAKDINALVDKVELEIFNREEREIPSKLIGEMIMTKLKDLDSVAYVRFASVYREFKDVNTFMDELKKILE